MGKIKKRNRLHVLLLAYSISPIRGSEYSVGWNHVREMAKVCDLTVLYGLAGPHMGDLQDMEEWFNENQGITNVTFEAIHPNWLAGLLNSPNRKGILVYSFYLAYRVWHKQALRCAMKILEKKEINLIHYLCPIGYREPGFLWQIDKPFVWGPVGGLVPTQILAGSPRPLKWTLKSRMKNILNSIQLATAGRVSSAMRAANVVVAATSENQQIIRSRFGVEAHCFAENAIPDEWLDVPATQKCPAGNQPVSLVWIGSLDTRKSPDLLVDAMSRLRVTNWHLHIIGDGPLHDVVKQIAANNGISDMITFHGVIPRPSVKFILESAGLHLITSMAEGNPTVLWEAMAAGIPTVSLDHNGMHDTICENCGVRVPVGSYAQTCDAFASAVEGLLRNQEQRFALRQGVHICRENYRWSQRVKKWLELYETAISHHKKGHTGCLLGSAKSD